MKAMERRQAILEKLEKAEQPLSASRLAEELGVSRQIIVGDVALLRAENHDIMATHRGYLLAERLQVPKSYYHGKLACKHSAKEVRLELETIVQNGGKILDVEVEHPIYGMITAPLNIESQDEIDYFMDKLSCYQGSLLSSLTGGIHLHRISCRDQKTFEKIYQHLKKEGLVFED
ncbi:3H domain-containing protein [Streptococcus caviae]|uniref:transcription repressor NadR n=1 Tax=Streptococcus sp. 'caviae' TaxID=1915004 RepID=UPI00094BA3E7|nr:transcription repressor NadR [Streptococcus sp. 'caviae']OLN84696.1 transcription repressor NadR [Streptococcus sp. 'caviae']